MSMAEPLSQHTRFPVWSFLRPEVKAALQGMFDDLEVAELERLLADPETRLEGLEEINRIMREKPVPPEGA